MGVFGNTWATNAAKGTFGNANANAGMEQSQANQIEGQLIPGLEQEATHPQGFSPTDVNNMLVMGQEGAGGTNSAIQGQEGLQALRTRNTGNTGALLDQAARLKGQTNSTNALGVANENANLKQKQQQFAQGMLGDQANNDTNAMLKSMGIGNEAVSNEMKAATSGGWLSNIGGFVKDLSGLGMKTATGGSFSL